MGSMRPFTRAQRFTLFTVFVTGLVTAVPLYITAYLDRSTQLELDRNRVRLSAVERRKQVVKEHLDTCTEVANFAVYPLEAAPEMLEVVGKKINKWNLAMLAVFMEFPQFSDTYLVEISGWQANFAAGFVGPTRNEAEAAERRLDHARDRMAKLDVTCQHVTNRLLGAFRRSLKSDE